MIKFLAKLFKKQNDQQNTLTAEEKYIRDHNPQSILDVENFAREFERKRAIPNHRSWSIL